jgi:hypothetical protein
MRRSLFAAIVAGTLAVFAPAYAADPQTFETEDSATKFCKPGQRGLVQSAVENLFRSRFPVLRQDQGRGLHLSGVCRQGRV